MLNYEPVLNHPFVDAGGPLKSHVEAWSSRGASALSSAVLMLGDVSAIFAAAAVGYVLWVRMVLHQPVDEYYVLLPMIALFPAAYASAGLYPGFGLGAVETLRRLVYCTNASFLTIAASALVFKASPIYSRMAFGIAWLTALAAVPFFRFVALTVAKRLRWWGERAVIVGDAAAAARVISALRKAFSLGYRVVGVILPKEGGKGHAVGGIPILGGLDAIDDLDRVGVGTALAWDGGVEPGTIEALHRRFRHVVLIRDGHSMPVERIQLRNLGGVLGIELRTDLLSRRNRVTKRVLDVVLGSVLLVLAAPFMAIFGLLVFVVSPGPVFFVQEREGVNGSRFKVWKLRTMYPDADRRLAECLANDPDLRIEWKQNLKLRRDPRVIPYIGSFMRRYSIDELPQLWNVVAGTMSLVGPRPFPEYHLALFGEDFRKLRRKVLPGMTGMWQVMIRSDGTVADQERFDTYYIHNWSLWLDIYLLARTVFVVLAASGAR